MPQLEAKSVLPATDVADTPAPPAPTAPRWWRALLSPVLDIASPSRAACYQLLAPRTTWLALLIGGLIGYAVILVGLMLWYDTLDAVWSSSPVGPTAPVSVSMVWEYGTYEIRPHSLAEIWLRWHADAPGGWLGPPEIVLILVLLLGPLVLCLVSWINLPLVHRTESIGRSFAHSARVTAGALWPAAALTLAAGSVLVAQCQAAYGENQLFYVQSSGLTKVVSIVACPYLLAFWLRRAIDTAGTFETAPVLPLVCEGCGYDLTHRPADERCPECGEALAASLDPARSRPGCGWARRRTVASWVGTTVRVLRHPRAFYRGLALRQPDSANRGFSGTHYLLVGCGAWAWFCGMLALDQMRMVGTPRSPTWEDFGKAALATSIGVFLLGLGHRVLAALVATWWLMRGGLRDFGWAVKVIRYETAYLWVLCCFWGVLVTSFMLSDTWISDLLGLPSSGWPLGVPLEPWVLFAGSVVLVTLWLWRYEIAYRAIRWSNF